MNEPNVRKTVQSIVDRLDYFKQVISNLEWVEYLRRPLQWRLARHHNTVTCQRNKDMNFIHFLLNLARDKRCSTHEHTPL